MKIKMISIKKVNTTTTTTEIFKCYKISILFDAQNAESRISELLDFRPPLGEFGKGPYSPFSCPSRLLHFQWPLITKVVETPVILPEDPPSVNKMFVVVVIFSMAWYKSRYTSKYSNISKNTATNR